LAYYQCFKTTSRTVYCSSQKFKSHAPAATWVAQCMANFQLQANDILGRPYESNDQPRGATIWP
jgi:hypothetical protein